MPELPEVEALAAHLRERAVGSTIERLEIAALSALKTYDPPPTALAGRTLADATRHGKFLDLVSDDGVHLIVHLARAGWLTYRESIPPKPAKPGKGPLAVRLRLADGSGFDLNEYGTQKRLAAYLVRDPAEVPGIARLGPDALAVTPEEFAAVLKSRRSQIKGTLTDQTAIAGIGNAYSDEILHAARLSPFAITNRIPDEKVETLYEAMVTTLRDAVERSVGQKAATLKAEKRSGMKVHGRTGEDCPICGDKVREVSFHDSSLQYCARCQTGGKPLADRRLSRLLR